MVDQNKKEGYKYNILRIQRKGKGNKYLEITKKMKPIIKISKLLNQRLQFLESLFLISSYQQLVTSNTNSLIQKHKHMQKDQIDTVTNILRAVRIDDVFKKQLHGVVLKVFLKVEAGSVVRQQATGAYKDIIADYLSFFGELKEKYIVDFIKQIFQLHIYNQTTVIYVLVQLLLKFLRIKCMSFITDRIEPKLSARQTLDPFSYLMLNQNDKKQHRAKAGNRHRNVTSPLSQINKRNISQDSKSSMSENFQIKSKTIGFQTEPRSNSNPRSNPSNRPHRQLHSASDKRQTIHHSVDASPSKPKRRIIKSYKDIQEQTKQKIMNRNIVLARQSSYSASRPYARMFLTVFREQWNEYLQLAGMREISDEEDEPETGVIKFGECSTSGFSNKRKLEWYNKNKEKVVVEACSRNDQIRRQMQNYSQSYSNKLKK